MTAAAMPSTPTATPPPPSKSAGRAYLAMSFVLGSLCTAGVGYVGQRYFFDYQQQQTDLLAKVAAFEKQSGDLPELVGKLNRALIDRKNTDKERAAVAANTREQFRTLTDALPYVPPHERGAAQEYLTTLANMPEEVQKADGILKAGPFLQEFEYSALNRDKVVRALRQTAGLAVAPEDVEGSNATAS